MRHIFQYLFLLTALFACSSQDRSVLKIYDNLAFRLEEALPDFTFRYKNEIKDSAIVNISIEGPELYKEIDGIAFSNGDEQYELSEVKLLYNSGSKSGYVSRFTAEFKFMPVLLPVKKAERLLPFSLTFSFYLKN